MLYEVDRSAQGQRHDGSVSWRIKTMSSELKTVIKADARISDRHMSVSMVLRRNTDKSRY